MLQSTSLCEHDGVQRSLVLPRAPRSSDRVLSGAAAGWAQRWGVEPTVVRVAVALLTFAAGLGVVLYGAMVVLSDPANTRPDRSISHVIDGGDPGRSRRELWRYSSLLAGSGSGRATRSCCPPLPLRSVWRSCGPTAFATTTPLRSHRSHDAPSGCSRCRDVGCWARLAGEPNRRHRRSGASASAIAVVIGGLAMFGAPALGRLLGDLDEERSMRIRKTNSPACQRTCTTPYSSRWYSSNAATTHAAWPTSRRQEREQPAWLYGDAPVGEPTTLHAAIEALTTEMENDHDTRIEAVIVGDEPLDDAARTLLAALREAIVNSAQHADVDRVDVFVEADDAELTGFVRTPAPASTPQRSEQGTEESATRSSAASNASAAPQQSIPTRRRHRSRAVHPEATAMNIRVVLVEDHGLPRRSPTGTGRRRRRRRTPVVEMSARQPIATKRSP